MKSDIKKGIGIVGVILLIVLAIYGSYLPLRKSKKYIQVTRAAQGVSTLTDFKALFDTALAVPSPIGQNELTRNTAGSLLSIIRNNSDPQLIAAVLEYVEQYYRPILTYGKGPSFSQDLYLMGLMYESAYLRTQDPSYLQASAEFFIEGNRRSPRRPQFLYGLFDVYRFAGDAANAERVAAEILAYWPDDAGIAQKLEEFRSRAAGSAASSTKKNAR